MEQSIIKYVCGYFGISVDMLLTGSRKREYVNARKYSMFFLRRYTNLPMSYIADLLGLSNHSMVVYNLKKVNFAIENYKKDKIEYEIMRDYIESKLVDWKRGYISREATFEKLLGRFKGLGEDEKYLWKRQFYTCKLVKRL